MKLTKARNYLWCLRTDGAIMHQRRSISQPEVRHSKMQFEELLRLDILSIRIALLATT
jgi:hypothetical protein